MMELACLLEGLNYCYEPTYGVIATGKWPKEVGV